MRRILATLIAFLAVAVALLSAGVAGASMSPDDRAFARVAPAPMSPDDRDFARVAPASMSPDDRAFARVPEDGRVPEDAYVEPSVVTVTSRGFDWGDAAIGSAFALALALLGAGAITVALRRRGALRTA
jgi:hypothetical protein